MTLDDQQARPWLHRNVAERLLAGGNEFLAEVRPVVALFARFSGLNYDREKNGKRLDAYVCWVQRLAAEFEGELIGVIIGDKGSYLYIAFGATAAHEDDPLRAIELALALGRPPPEFGLGGNPQIGISTGRMSTSAYGAKLRRAYSVQGHEVNLAARLMSKAAPGQVLVTERMANACSRRFVVKRHPGMTALKGIDGEVSVHAVIGRNAARARQIDTGNAPPLVGREREQQALRDALERLAAGSVETLVIEGAAGLGKSRLLVELAAQATARGIRLLTGAAEQIARNQPLHAWRPLFSEVFQLAPDERGAVTRARVLAKLEGLPEITDRLPLLNAVLPLHALETPASATLVGKVRADRTIELLLEILEHESTGAPIVLVLDDAHWMDPLSLGLIRATIERLDTALVALATRTVADISEIAAIAAHEHTTHLHLNTLEGDSTRSLVAWQLGVTDLPDALCKFIQSKAEGHPFFSEEIAYALRDKGLIDCRAGCCRLTHTNRLEDLDFPSTIHGVVMSRLDRLNPAQQLVLKVASVVGRSFPFAALAHAYPDSEYRPRLRENLEVLEHLDITPMVSPEPDLAHMFRHSLARDVVYGNLLSTQRQRLHSAVAAWYEEVYADDLEPHLVVLAHHWREVAAGVEASAAQVDKAITYLRQAASQSTNSGMPIEAVAFGMDALRLLGMDLPSDIDAIGAAIAAGEAQIQRSLAGRSPAELIDLPQMSEERPGRIIEILLEIMPAAFMAQRAETFALAAITNLRLLLRHGHCPHAPVAYAMYAILRRNMYQDPEGAHAFSRLALALDRRMGGHTFGVVGFIHCWFIDHWRNPLRESLPLSLKAAAAAFDTGNVLFGCYNLSGYVLYSAAASVRLTELKEVARIQNAAINGRGLSSTFHCVIELQYAKALAGETSDRTSMSDAEYDETADLASICDTDQYNQMVYYHVARLKLHTLYREYEQGLKAAAIAYRLLPAAGGQIAEVELRFFFALAALGHWNDAAEPARTELQAKATEEAEIIRGWAALCPANFAHKSLLVDAELARVGGRDDEALAVYRTAASAAYEHGYLQYAALAHELAGRFLVQRGDVQAARAAFDAAANTYQEWGAQAKVVDVAAQRP